MTKIEKINQIIDRVEGDSFSEKLLKARKIVEDEEDGTRSNNKG